MQKENSKKNIVQDVVPKGRSIRNIELPSRRARPDMARQIPTEISGREVKIKKPDLNPAPSLDTGFSSRTEAEDGNKPPYVPPYTYNYDNASPKRSRKGLYISLFLLVLAAAFGVSALFKSATVTVTPRHDTKPLSDTFTAKKDAQGSDLGFQVVTVTKDVEKKVPATGEQKVNSKARGTIIIYNNESTTAQRLIATTRFENPDGLVYRLVAPVTIPGKKTVSGNIVAGSVEAAVEADQPGIVYNIGLSDFTLPAFKGDPKYKTIYARSKTAMTGGASGMQKTVSADVLAAADSSMMDDLKSALTREVTSQIPDSFVLFPSDISYNISPAFVSGADGADAIVRKKGTAQALIFDRAALSRAIVYVVSTGEATSTATDDVMVSNLDDLSFAYPQGSSFNGSASTVSFTLSGTANLVWTVDQNTLVTDLLGLSKNQAHSVIASYPSIENAVIETQPFWNQTIPKDQSKVTFVNTLAK